MVSDTYGVSINFVIGGGGGGVDCQSTLIGRGWNLIFLLFSLVVYLCSLGMWS